MEAGNPLKGVNFLCFGLLVVQRKPFTHSTHVSYHNHTLWWLRLSLRHDSMNGLGYGAQILQRARWRSLDRVEEGSRRYMNARKSNPPQSPDLDGREKCKWHTTTMIPLLTADPSGPPRASSGCGETATKQDSRQCNSGQCVLHLSVEA
jgi:hypothetical protein